MATIPLTPSGKAVSSGAVDEKEAVKGSYACMSGASVDGSGRA